MHPRPNADQPGPPSRPGSVLSTDKGSPSFSQSRSADISPIFPENVKAALKTPSIASDQISTTPTALGSTPGYRAAESYVRPSPIAVQGSITSYGFDLRNCVFTLSLEGKQAAVEDVSTEVFLPEFHFPQDEVSIEVSSGKWTIGLDDVDGGLVQKLKWIHGHGKQNLTVKGVRRRQGMALGKEEEEGYLEQCRQSNCSVM